MRTRCNYDNPRNGYSKKTVVGEDGATEIEVPRDRSGSFEPLLRSIVHALRGWPTPLGVALNSTVKLFDDDGHCLDESAKKQLELMGQQVFQFARMKMR